MMNYENFNMNEPDSYTMFTKVNLTWGAHFHRAIEIIMVTDGEIICTIGGRDYTLHPFDAVLIMPNQIHSIKTCEYSRINLIRFSPKLVGTFFKQWEHSIPENNQFRLTQALKLSAPTLSKPTNIFHMKGLLYTIVGDFFNSNPTWLPIPTDLNLIHRLIMYIEENFKTSCTLESAARELNYNYSYLSKEFLKISGITFMEYLNNCRIIHACYLLENTDMSITQIAYECGYNTIRTFNRNFLKYANTTPAKYLQEQARKNQHTLS